jgi:hypothetical protein
MNNDTLPPEKTLFTAEAPQPPKLAYWITQALLGMYAVVVGAVTCTARAIWTSLCFFVNKGPAIALLGYGYYRFDLFSKEVATLQAAGASAPPFGEIYYAGLSFGAAIILGLFARLLIFPEVAEYAEKGKLREDMEGSVFRVRTIQYWVATVLCIGGALFCMFNLPK